MSDGTATAMDAIGIAEFLGRRETGVLSLARDDEGYAVPVSFTYDESDSNVYFRLGYAPGSRKRRFVDASERVSFVVYADTDEGWKSVVARGRLAELSTTSLDSNVVEAVRNLEIPFFQVHQQPARELTFSVVRLDVETLDGVVEASDAR